MHLDGHGQLSGSRSFLVSRQLPRARQLLLEDLAIRWVRGTIEEIAENVLA